MASYLTVMDEIHVLLVDHDLEDLFNTAKLLEICQYRVTLAQLASVAITMLISEKTNFDIVLANFNSPDLHGYKLVHHAVNMNKPIILMSVDDNASMAMRALEDGAFLYIRKPATMEMLRCLWQHVMREKMHMLGERDRLMKANCSTQGIGFREVIPQADYHLNINIGGSNKLTMKDKGKSTKKIREKKGISIEEEYDLKNYMIMNNNKMKRKVCTEWTQELHEKFMEAVEQLGEGRCFPKDILELMNVPGLTRMQVASHLQKCRNANWRTPKERKSYLLPLTVSSDNDGSQNKPRRFGSMPRLGTAASYHTEVHNGARKSSEIHSDSENIENTSHNQHYESLVSEPNNAIPNTSSLNPRHQSDGFFSFPEMDSLIENYSGLPQGSAGMKNPNSSSGGYHFDHGQQNPTVPSMDSKSQGSSTLNFENDDAETKSH